MPNHYHDENDLKLLKDMKALAPEEFRAWAALDGVVAREDGKIPRKYRELIALAVAHTRRGSSWPPCHEVLRPGLARFSRRLSSRNGGAYQPLQQTTGEKCGLA